MRLTKAPRPLAQLPLGALFAAALLFLPVGAHLVESGRVQLSTCGMKQAFDLPCFSCGSTRATIALLHGELGRALLTQPLTMLIYSLVAVWGAVSLWALATHRSVRLELNRRERIVATVLLVSLPFLNWAYLYQAGI